MKALIEADDWRRSSGAICGRPLKAPFLSFSPIVKRMPAVDRCPICATRRLCFRNSERSKVETGPKISIMIDQSDLQLRLSYRWDSQEFFRILNLHHPILLPPTQDPPSTGCFGYLSTRFGVITGFFFFLDHRGSSWSWWSISDWIYFENPKALRKSPKNLNESWMDGRCSSLDKNFDRKHQKYRSKPHKSNVWQLHTHMIQ